MTCSLKLEKVEAKNLQPFTTYYYQFTVCDSTNTSPLGRTKTTPEKDATVKSPVRIAVYSCSNYRTRFPLLPRSCYPFKFFLLTD